MLVKKSDRKPDLDRSRLADYYQEQRALSL